MNEVKVFNIYYQGGIKQDFFVIFVQHENDQKYENIEKIKNGFFAIVICVIAFDKKRNWSPIIGYFSRFSPIFALQHTHWIKNTWDF